MLNTTKLLSLTLVFIINSVNIISGQSISFTKSAQTFPPSVTFEVILEDVDNDGDLDAVFSNMEFYNCQIWLNDGSGIFTNSGQNLTQQAHGVALGDLDGDSDLDLFVTCAHFYSAGWSYKPSKIYFNDGNGIFTDSGQDLNDTNISGNLVELIDVDNDNDLDAYVVYYPPPGKLFINDGTGIFTDSGQDLPFCASWGDLDSDGDLDFFVKDEGSGYRVMLNDGTGNFIEGWSTIDIDATMDYNSSALEDFDNDGDLDVLITNGTHTDAKPFKILSNDGNGNFLDIGTEYGLINVAWIRIGDFNNDAIPDVFFSIVDNPNQIWLNDGNGNFIDSGLRMSGNTKTRGSSLGDLDNDGDLDIFVGIYDRVSNEIWFNDTVTTIETNDLNPLPEDFKLFQNYPNPFNPETKIEYSLSEIGRVIISVYDLLGSEITTLVDKLEHPGKYNFTWNPTGEISGIYFIKMDVFNLDRDVNHTQTIKVTFLK
ncbi:MAG: FG-GAP-like repeat-containing protein [bacterium]